MGNKVIKAHRPQGLMLGQTGDKLGFMGATPIVQYAGTPLDVTGFAAGSGTASKSDSGWAGKTGSTAYGVGDIVTVLKYFGFLKV